MGAGEGAVSPKRVDFSFKERDQERLYQEDIYIKT